MLCKSNTMTKERVRAILASDKCNYMRHFKRKVTKYHVPGLFEMEMPGFYLIGGLEEVIEFLFRAQEV